MALLLVVVHAAVYAAGKDVALITALQGRVWKISAESNEPSQSAQPQVMQAYVKLTQGDQLALDKDARLQLVYLDSGRLETWRGGVRLEINSTESQAFSLPDPQVRMLSSEMVRQISRMPVLDAQGQAKTTKSRSIATPDALAGIENTYRRLRNETPDRSDLNPELYLLSGMFEMRELGRVEQVLSDLQRERGSEPQVKLLVSLYQRAMKNVREAKRN
ncbi:MAG: hypothetical protein WC073_07200 [Sterolibacterium sp.]